MQLPLWLKFAIFSTYCLQIGLLLLQPVPSPVSTRRKLKHTNNSVSSSVRSSWLILPALLGITVPLVFILVPITQRSTILLSLSVPLFFPYFSFALLLCGNFVILSAVYLLRHKVTFTEDGESKKLVTSGIFYYIQHPIVLGLGLLYTAVFLVVPNLISAIGLASYIIHQRYRLKLEEKLLEHRFGNGYAQYRNTTGRFWPKAKK